MIDRSLSGSSLNLGVLGLALTLIALYFFQYPQDLQATESVFLSVFIATASGASALSGFSLSIMAIFKREWNGKLIVGLVSSAIGVSLNPLTQWLLNGT